MVKRTVRELVSEGLVVVHRYSPAEYRFWGSIDDNGPIHPVLKTRCWLWTGYKSDCGYGRMRWDGKQGKVHRYCWELHYGPIPDDLWVLHKCDVRNCCNPSHLFLGTHQDNVDDREAKGRNITHCGEKNGNSKLTEEKVRHIRRNYPKLNYKQLAKIHKVSNVLVGLIVRRKIWKHVI